MYLIFCTTFITKSYHIMLAHMRILDYRLCWRPWCTNSCFLMGVRCYCRAVWWHCSQFLIRSDGFTWTHNPLLFLSSTIPFMSWFVSRSKDLVCCNKPVKWSYFDFKSDQSSFIMNLISLYSTVQHCRQTDSFGDNFSSNHIGPKEMFLL